MKDLVPQFTINGEAVPPGRVTVVPGGPVGVPRADRTAAGARGRLESPRRRGSHLEPARELGAADARELGLLIDRVEIGPE